MKYKTRMTVMRIAAGFAILFYAGGSGAQSFLATGADAEVTEDGLHRVDDSIMGAAWVRPDLDLSGYTRIYFSPATVEFREITDGARVARIGDSASYFDIDEGRQVRFRERWAQVLYEDLSEVETYEMFDTVGRDVLLIQGRLIDVASGVPPDTAASVATTILYPWEATIVLELRDSMSDRNSVAHGRPPAHGRTHRCSRGRGVNGDHAAALVEVVVHSARRAIRAVCSWPLKGGCMKRYI